MDAKNIYEISTKILKERIEKRKLHKQGEDFKKKHPKAK